MENSSKERIVDEVLLLLPVIGRLIDRPDSLEKDEIARQGIPTDVHVSPGHVQIMIALAGGPHSVRQLAEVLGVSSPAITQLVDRLVEMGMVERRHHTEDRRVVLVDYVPGMQEIARRIVGRGRLQLNWVVERMTLEESEAFVKGLRLLVRGLGSTPDTKQREEIQ
ncbi:MAG: MarR family transcriptional regulator [Actinomycetota bacterium]|nr:MarR family transcriptional regulator [Actinomycetota bacterium]